MLRSEEVRPARGKNLSLPIQLWPDADRNAWVAACKPATRLRGGGAAGHLKPVTRDDHAAHYGNFLGFLDRCGLLGRDGPPAANVTPENVERYLDELRGRLTSTTVHGTICRLRRIAHYIAPSLDLAWLAEIGKDLKLLARPRSKSDRLVLTEVLVEAGLTLIHEAKRSRTMTKLGRLLSVANPRLGKVGFQLPRPLGHAARLNDSRYPGHLIDRSAAGAQGCGTADGEIGEAAVGGRMQYANGCAAAGHRDRSIGQSRHPAPRDPAAQDRS